MTQQFNEVLAAIWTRIALVRKYLFVFAKDAMLTPILRDSGRKL